tara:strand:+ start:287 stop:889 length:603 start_codon:yes stop_codon:yes gene_type:complete
MNDLVQVIKILNKADLKKVNAALDKVTFIPSSVGFSDGDSGIPRIDSNIRSSSNAFLEEGNEATTLLHEGMNKALLEYKDRLIRIHPIFDGYPVPGGLRTTSEREMIQVLEYVRNQKYVYHQDASTQRGAKEYHRMISIITYLTDDFEGGATSFLDSEYKPPAGYGLIFPSNWAFPHAGLPVKKGKKRIAVTWYYVMDNI